MINKRAWIAYQLRTVLWEGVPDGGWPAKYNFQQYGPVVIHILLVPVISPARKINTSMGTFMKMALSFQIAMKEVHKQLVVLKILFWYSCEITHLLNPLTTANVIYTP